MTMVMVDNWAGICCKQYFILSKNEQVGYAWSIQFFFLRVFYIDLVDRTKEKHHY